MSGPERVLVEKKGAIAWLTINRPDKLNALDRRTMQEIDAAVGAAGEDPAVGVVIVTGMGEKAFVAGADIAELASQSPVEGAAYARRGQDILMRLERLGKPSIAAVNGYALGGGLELAMACDIIVASDTARFGLPEVTRGIIAGAGGIHRLPRPTQ